MKNKISQTIKKHKMLEKDAHIIVGLSGGPDSVCLFDVLLELSGEMNWKIYAVHVNHMLRPGAAEEDQNYVEELCKSHQVPCHVITVDCKEIATTQNITSEEAGRNARYGAFSQVAMSLLDKGIEKEKIAIALAHNANDQAETILFRILRGTGTDGLAGIPYKRKDENGFSIVRPILDVNREEIEDYCKTQNLNPKIDHTNSENIYTRNKIRNMLIPYIEENFNENIIDTVNRMGKISAEDREFMRKEAKLAYEEALCGDANVSLWVKPLQRLHKAIRIRVYTIALECIGMTQNLTFAQASKIDDLIFSKSPSAMCDLSQNFAVSREYEKLAFLNQEQLQEDETQWKFSEMTVERFKEFKKLADSKGKQYGVFGGVNLKELCLRTRKEGDRIKIESGTKTIKNFFVDEKIPKLWRDQMLLLTKGSEVLWVLPSEYFAKENLRQKGRFSADFKGTDQTDGTIIVLEKL